MAKRKNSDDQADTDQADVAEGQDNESPADEAQAAGDPASEDWPYSGHVGKDGEAQAADNAGEAQTRDDERGGGEKDSDQDREAREKLAAYDAERRGEAGSPAPETDEEREQRLDLERRQGRQSMTGSDGAADGAEAGDGGNGYVEGDEEDRDIHSEIDEVLGEGHHPYFDKAKLSSLLHHMADCLGFVRKEEREGEQQESEQA